jgi:hypothetical protein
MILSSQTQSLLLVFISILLVYIALLLTYSHSEPALSSAVNTQVPAPSRVLSFPHVSETHANTPVPSCPSSSSLLPPVLPQDSSLTTVSSYAGMNIPGLDRRRMFPQLWLCPNNPGFPHFEPSDVKKAQCKEDELLWENFIKLNSTHNTPANPGIFLEIGALDGEALSNTWFYEKFLNWRGVLIDALPANARRLVSRTDRSNSLRLHMAVCELPQTEIEFLWSDDDTTGVGGTVKDMDPGIKAVYHPDLARRKTAMMPCGPLGVYLMNAGITYINFFSLDVEGGELSLLQTFPFDLIKVQFIFVEVNSQRPAIEGFLVSKGFVPTISTAPPLISILYHNPSFKEVPFSSQCFKI